jgi:hypothetical protein
MWGRRKKEPETPPPVNPLKEAVREARIEVAERSAVIVDLRDAELARLELLNEALDPLFAEIPASVELFDRGISKGDVPRLWVDVIAHVEMGRDKRQYRFVQDTRYGRAVLAESHEIPEIVNAVTRYVARRLLERERALSDDAPFGMASSQKLLEQEERKGQMRAVRYFIYGVVVAVAVLLTLALLNGPRP